MGNGIQSQEVEEHDDGRLQQPNVRREDLREGQAHRTQLDLEDVPNVRGVSDMATIRSPTVRVCPPTFMLEAAEHVEGVRQEVLVLDGHKLMRVRPALVSEPGHALDTPPHVLEVLGLPNRSQGGVLSQRDEVVVVRCARPEVLEQGIGELRHGVRDVGEARERTNSCF